MVILFYFRELKGSKSLKRRNLSASFVLLQYVPRVVQIYLSLKDPMRRAKKFFSTPIWVKAAFNFLLYIIASHVSFILYLISYSWNFTLKSIFFFNQFFFLKKKMRDFVKVEGYIKKKKKNLVEKQNQRMKNIVYINLLLRPF